MPKIFPSYGASYGFSNAQRNIRQALEKQNVLFAFKADIELLHASSHLYNRHNYKRSVLWFPYEAHHVPSKLIAKANEADMIIASCAHNRQTFMQCGITKPIKMCRLGIDIDKYKFKIRKVGKRFIFLWVGQNNIRKGWDLIPKAFAKSFTKNDAVVLIMKTTGGDRQEVFQLHENIFIDSRNLSDADMLDMYYSANAFVFPSRGEGSGLPAIEAMSTGCLVIAPAIQGLKEFINNETAMPLKYEMIKAKYGVDTIAPNVLVSDLAMKMRMVYENYETYRDKMKYGSDFINKYFSLDVMSVRLVDILWN